MSARQRIAVLVHDRLEAEAALALATAAGCELELVMAAGSAGPAFVQALEALLDHPITALCDDRPGLAMEALRVGLRRLVLEPGSATTALPSAADRLADIARQLGGELRQVPPAPLHVLRPDRRGFAVLVAPATVGPAARLVP